MSKIKLLQRARKTYWHSAFVFSYNLRLEQVPHPPLVINLEPTNHCNLRCPFCPVSQKAEHPEVERGLMNASVFGRIVPQLATFSPMVAINLGGESLLHPSLPEMIGRLADIGCYVFLDTNALLLSPQVSDALLRSGLAEIVLCIDGEGDPESYARMRVRGHLDRVVQNVRYFLARRREIRGRTPKTVIKNIRYFRSGESARVPSRIVELFEDNPPDVFRATWADYWPGDHVSKLKQAYPVEPYSAHDYEPCTNLWKKLAISWDGKVYACCLDLNRTTEIGDATRDTLAEIWNGDRIRHLRRLHREKRQAEITLCRNCTMIRRSPVRTAAGLLALRAERFTRWSDG